MSQESNCLKVRKTLGEEAIVLANRLGIFNRELQIQRDNEYVYIPLIRRSTENESRLLEQRLPNYAILTRVFPERNRRVPLLALLRDELPRHLLFSLPHSVDFVGDIAIIEVPPELDVHKTLIGETILKVNRNVRTVLAKAGAIGGTYRTRDFTIVAGESRTETTHKEYECQFYLDVAKVYFSPRLSFEHHRVASLVKEGENVVDLFAGVGPFAVQIAKMRQDVEVFAVDLNPYAFEYLKRNIRINRVEGKVHPFLGDARQVVRRKLFGIADRVIMNLPENALEFVDVACETIGPDGGTVHFYSFVSTSHSLSIAESIFDKAVEECGRKVEEVLFSRLVRGTAPYEWQSVLDATIV